MVINLQLIAYALALFIALGIIFIGIREWFQLSIAARASTVTHPAVSTFRDQRAAIRDRKTHT